MILEAQVSLMVYLHTLLGIVGIGGIEWWLAKKSRKIMKSAELELKVFNIEYVIRWDCLKCLMF